MIIFSTSTKSMWLQKIASCITKLKRKLIVFMAIILLSLNASAHVFEIRYKQAPDGSITWYLISYHNTEQCPAEEAGLTINGINYPITSYIIGDARPLTPNILVQDLPCCSRLNPNNTGCLDYESLYVSYGIVNTPFLGGVLAIAPYSNAVCFAFCVGSTVIFNPPPVVNCPGNVSQNADAAVCNALVSVPGPTVVDNCTYSGANPELVTNGDFSGLHVGWNQCVNTVEAYCTETCYGGPNGANRVAEIDHQPVTLCQNINGFVIGKIYQLKFKATRRTQTPTPATVGAIVTINGGALNTTVSRSNTVWGFTNETFTFIATQTTHQLKMVPTAGWGGTYGLIVDDVSIKKQMGSIINNFNNTSDASGTYPVGTTNVVWTITHCDGSTATCNQTVTVIDNEKPVITAPPVLLCFETGNYGCNANLGATATDNCAVLSFTSNAPTCFPVGITTVTWTATDVNGNTATATQLVTRNPQISITLCAGPTRTIYTGTTSGVGPFGPQSVNLTSQVSGGTPGYSYSWSPVTGLNNATIANPIASPTVTTTYVLTVTDSKGCTRSMSITINVLPLSAALCGNGGGIKFLVCHIPPGNPANEHNICISVNALNAHLTSGSNGHNNCYLGPCQERCFSTNDETQLPANASRGGGAEPKAVSIEDEVAELTIKTSPNPSTTFFILQIQSADKQTPASVRVIDGTGKPTQLFSKIAIGSTLSFGNSYQPGIYFVEVTQGNQRKISKLIKL